MKEITKFKKRYLEEAEKELDSISGEDLDMWTWSKISNAISKAYKIGKEEKKNK